MRSRFAWVVAATLLAAAAIATAQPRRNQPAPQNAPAAQATPTPATTTVATVAANVCVAPEARARATECPAGAQRYGTHGSTAPPAAARAVQEGQTPNANKQQRRPGAELDVRTLRRQQNLQQRSEELLRREADLTATLVRRMNANDAHRADTLMRLAEDYHELSTMKNGQAEGLEEQIFQARQANNTAQVTALTTRQTALRTEARDFRTRLINAFQVLVRDHPNYNHMDQALFYLAFAHQDSGDFDSARTVYRTLIQRFPQSPFVPNAYLSFAEYYFDRGEMENARTFYERVLQVQDESNQVFGYALYKMAWVLYNLQEHEQALQTFYRVIDYGRAHPDSPSVQPLLRNARMELVSVYGMVYGNAQRPLNPGQAFNTFQRYAADENNAYEMFERLAELYQDNGQWPNSITCYHSLMERQPTSDKFCRWQARVARAVVASRPKPEQRTEVQRLVDVYNTFRNSQRAQEVKNQCRDEAARVVFDVASHWHLEAIGRSAEGQQQTRGTRDARTMEMVAQLYQLLLDEFPDLDQVQFPEYDQRDWPSRYRITYYRADILRDQGNVQECGPAYDRVVEMNPQGEFTEDAAYKAVLCYNDWFSQQFQGSRERPARTNTGGRAAGGRRGQQQTEEQRRAAERARVLPREFNNQEQGMLRAFTRYVCFVRDTTRQEGQEEDPRTVMLTIKYRRAYLWYTTNHFEEAATLFSEIATSDVAVPDPENLREIAGDLYLDSLNVMGSLWSPERPACYDTMAEELPRLLGLFCTAQARPQHEEFCHRVEELQCQVLRKKAESLHATRRFSEAARAYVEIVRRHRECGALDEMLYNAAIEYDAANLLGRSMRVRTVLVDRFLPRNSPWAQRALYRLAGNYHAIQVFSRAAELYEQYAEYVNGHRQEAVAAAQAAARVTGQTAEDPVEQAADALRQATIFRIGLGEDDRAIQNAQKFERFFGRDPQRRRAAANVAFSIGQIFVDRVQRLRRETGGTTEERHARQAQIRQAWSEVVRHYDRYMRTYAAQGTLDQRIQGAVALARGYWNREERAQAATYFRQAVDAWGEQPTGENAQAPGERTIREQLGDQAGDAVEKSKEAVAEARFYLAEQLYERFRTRTLPVYRGSGSRAAYDRWATNTLQPFIREQQRFLNEDASRQYTQVVNMHVPNWEVAAYSRLGDMFYQFAQYIRTSPPPPDVARNSDLLDAYNVMRDEFTQQFVDVARVGFERCITQSTRVHWFNDWSRLCEQQLNAIDRARYPLADEVRVEPTLLFSRASNARAVYQLQTAEEAEEESQSGGGEAQPQQGANRGNE